MICPTCGHDDDPEQGLASLMMGGDDYPANNSKPLSPEQQERIMEMARELCYKAALNVAELYQAGLYQEAISEIAKTEQAGSAGEKEQAGSTNDREGSQANEESKNCPE